MRTRFKQLKAIGFTLEKQSGSQLAVYSCDEDVIVIQKDGYDDFRLCVAEHYVGKPLNTIEQVVRVCHALFGLTLNPQGGSKQ